MTDHRFPEEWRQGVYEAIARRRDMRSFKSQPLEKEVLARILKAAHQAGSVGYCQPWNFIVIESNDLRSKIHSHVTQERLKAAENFEGERREKYLAYKLEGILDSAVNVCVTCDRTRFGPTVIGRNTMKDTDIYSTCGAVQNLWLAARAEGVGVGWVSILGTRKTSGLPGFSGSCGSGGLFVFGLRGRVSGKAAFPNERLAATNSSVRSRLLRGVGAGASERND